MMKNIKKYFIPVTRIMLFIIFLTLFSILFYFCNTEDLFFIKLLLIILSVKQYLFTSKKIFYFPSEFRNSKIF